MPIQTGDIDALIFVVVLFALAILIIGYISWCGAKGAQNYVEDMKDVD